MSSCTTKMWVMTIVPPLSGSGDLLKDRVLAIGRVRPDLGLPLAEVGSLLPGRAVDDLGRIDLVDRQVARHRRDRRMLEPIARAGADPGDLEDRRHVILVIDAVEIGFEVLGDVHNSSVTLPTPEVFGRRRAGRRSAV